MGAEAAAAVQEHVEKLPKLEPGRLASIASHVETRQRAVGFAGDLDAWIKQVTPPDRV
jgi:hypothetical protein